MSNDLFVDFAGVVEGTVCGVSGCTYQPVAERNDRMLCGRHAKMRDHRITGRPCQYCDSREWIELVDHSEAVAECVSCGAYTYDESKIQGSW